MREREKERESERVCECMCMRERQRKREREKAHHATVPVASRAMGGVSPVDEGARRY